MRGCVSSPQTGDLEIKTFQNLPTGRISNALFAMMQFFGRHTPGDRTDEHRAYAFFPFPPTLPRGSSSPTYAGGLCMGEAVGNDELSVHRGP